MILLLIIAYFVLDFLGGYVVSKKGYRWMVLSFYFLLGIVIGLRNENIGVDTPAYYEAYNATVNMSLIQSTFLAHMEIGYVFCTKICQYIGLNYFQFQLCYSLIMMLLFGNFIIKNTNHPYFATTVFLGAGFFAPTYNIIRQMMAIAICANAWPYIKNKQYIRSIIIIIIAASFHMTAILFSVAIILYIFRKKIIMRYGFTLFLIYLPILLPSIFNLIQEYNPYEGYADTDKVGLKGGWVYVLWLIEILLTLCILFGKSFSSLDKVIANLALFCIIMFMMDEKVRHLDRIGLIFSPFVILMFCTLGKKIAPYKVQNLYYIGCSLFFLIFFIYRSSDLLNWTVWI